MKDDITLSQELADSMLSASEGTLVKESAAATTVVRTRIREDGFQRKILPFVKITNADLNELPDSELPAIIELLEPDSPAAKSIGYNDSPDSVPFRGEKFVVLINIITTPELTKNINELRTYKHDIRQIVTDNLLRDIHTEEDSKFLAHARRICGNSIGQADQDYAFGGIGSAAAATADSVYNTTTGVPSAATSQYVSFPGAITRESYKLTRNFLEDRDLNIGVALINRRTANQFLGMGREEFGGDKSQDMMVGGLKAKGSLEFMGINHIATIKRNLVANGEIFQFASPDFLGRAYCLEDIKITIKKDYDIFRLRAQEQVGLTIGNTRGIQRIQFTKERAI